MKKLHIIILALAIMLAFCGVASANDYVKLSENKAITLYVDQDLIYVKPDREVNGIYIDCWLKLDLNDTGREKYSQIDQALANASYIMVHASFEYERKRVTQREVVGYGYDDRVIYHDKYWSYYAFNHQKHGSEWTDWEWWGNMVLRHANAMYKNGAKVDDNGRMRY